MPETIAAIGRGFSNIRRALRQIVGMPNYEAYLLHLREHHPELTAPTEREYFDAYLKARYESGPTRCC